MHFPANNDSHVWGADPPSGVVNPQPVIAMGGNSDFTSEQRRSVRPAPRQHFRLADRL